MSGQTAATGAPRGPETGLSLPVESVGGLLAPWRDTALTGSSPHHVTILYPWLPPPISDEMVNDIADIAADIEPFEAQLTGVATFDSGVVYLTPEPADRFSELTTRLCEAFPSCEPYHGLEPVPHLTAARIRSEAAITSSAIERLADELREAVAPMLPFDFAAGGLSLGQSDEQGRWSRHSYHPFGHR